MELYEFFDAALDGVEPMADQVPAVIRRARRERTVRRARLGAVGAAFVIGAGTLVVAAPWSANTNMAPGEQAMNLPDYHKLVDSTLARLWPASAGTGPVTTVGLYFGAGPVPAGEMLPPKADRPPDLELAVLQQSAAQARQSETCPQDLNASDSRSFCTESTLPDGTVVQVTNAMKVQHSSTDQFSVLPVQYAYEPAGSDVAGGGSTIVAIPPAGSVQPAFTTGPVELTVWHGDTAEVLILSADYPDLPAQASSIKPSVSALTAIGTSDSFQGLLDTALANGFIPTSQVSAVPPLVCDTAVAVTTAPGRTPTAHSSRDATTPAGPPAEFPPSNVATVWPSVTAPTIPPTHAPAGPPTATAAPTTEPATVYNCTEPAAPGPPTETAAGGPTPPASSLPTTDPTAPPTATIPSDSITTAPPESIGASPGE